MVGPPAVELSHHNDQAGLLARHAKFYRQLRKVCTASFGERLVSIELHFKLRHNVDWETLGLVQSLHLTAMEVRAGVPIALRPFLVLAVMSGRLPCALLCSLEVRQINCEAGLSNTV